MTQLTQFDYFYDQQQVRFLQQIVRAFSGFQYMSGSIAGQPPQLQTVPCTMAQTNLMVSNILRNQSENTIMSTPLITVWQTGLSFSADRLQNRNHVDTRQVVERAIDPETNSYTAARGNGYTVRRLMPIPMEMTVEVNLWTSNNDQKYQLTEQINIITVPNFDIQNSENALDWTALSTVYLDTFDLSSRSIPIGTSNEIDVATWRWRLPIWLSPPAEIKAQRLIEQIVTNVNSTTSLPQVGIILDGSGDPNITRAIVTPDNRSISIQGNQVYLLGPNGVETDANGDHYAWLPYLNLFGPLRPAISLLAIKITDDINGPQVVGTLQATGDPNVLQWQIDPSTLPPNTLPAVDAVIDPMKNYPITGGLPAPTEGTRYLIVNGIGPSITWGAITAEPGDIIQYTNGAWIVSFDASAAGNTMQFVLNNHSSNQLKWNGEDWVMVIDGVYRPGYWRLWL